MKENFLYRFVKKHSITKPLFVGYCIAFTLICYYAFFIVFGDKGLTQLLVLKKQIENKEAIKQEIFAKMQSKKGMVESMNLNSLDIDLLDEQARKVLGYVGKNEVVIYQDQKTLETKSSTSN